MLFDIPGSPRRRVDIRFPVPAPRSRGFTLIEILAVIALIAIAVTVTAFSLRGLGRERLEAAAHEIAAGLRDTRTRAMVAHRAQWFTVNLHARTFAAPGRDPKSLPKGAEVTVTSAAEDARQPGIARIRYFPDGSSTGGNIVLSLDRRSVRVDVDWLTGAVAVSDEASR